MFDYSNEFYNVFWRHSGYDCLFWCVLHDVICCLSGLKAGTATRGRLTASSSTNIQRSIPPTWIYLPLHHTNPRSVTNHPPTNIPLLCVLWNYIMIFPIFWISTDKYLWIQIHWFLRFESYLIYIFCKDNSFDKFHSAVLILGASRILFGIKN